MQDFSVSAAAWTAPEVMNADPRMSDDGIFRDVNGDGDSDETLLAQFEALLPLASGESADASGTDIPGPVGGIGVATAFGFAATASRSEAGGLPVDVQTPAPDAILSSYTIHHARVGVVHVVQSAGMGGTPGLLTLRTEDDALRNRLRAAVPALRSALADDGGRGPDVSVAA